MSDSTVNANANANRLAYLNQGYSNYVGMSDSLMDGDVGANSLSMNGSLFGGGLSYMGGPGAEIYGMNQKQYLNYNTELTQQQMKSQTDLQKYSQVEDFRANADNNAISSISQSLHRQVLSNQQDKFKALYDDLTSAVKQKYASLGYQIPDSQIKAEVEKQYFAVTGTKMVDDLEANGDNSFVKGLKDGFLLSGLYLNDKTSAQQNISMVTGDSVSKADTVAMNTGMALGGIATIVTLPFILRGVIASIKGLAGITIESFKKIPLKKIPLKV